MLDSDIKNNKAGNYETVEVSTGSEMRVGDRDNKVILHPDFISTEKSQVEYSFKISEEVFERFKVKTDKSKRIAGIFTLEKMHSIILAYCKFTDNLGKSGISSENLVVKDNLFAFLCDPNFLMYAYSLIKNNKVASGLDGVLSHNMTLSGIAKLAESIRLKKYKCRPVRRVYIPKANGSKRPLGIASTRDKIVQMAVKLLLEPILDSRMSNSSHGFRKGRSCHSCLKEIAQKWPMTVWLLEFDIVKMFDRINHRRLINILRSHFDDKDTLNVIREMLKVNYVSLVGLSDSNLEQKLGSPQGSIISPLLANIYLDPFDKWVENYLLPKYNTTRIYNMDPEYTKLRNWTEAWVLVRKSISDLLPGIKPREIRTNVNNLKKKYIIKKDLPYYKLDIHYKRLKYVRYADDFLFGFIGDKSTGIKIMQEVCGFIEGYLSLEINKEKSGIVHHKKGVLFLGYHIWGNYFDNFKIRDDNQQRVIHTRLKLSVPVDRLFNRYRERGMFQFAKKGNVKKIVARRLDKWIFLPQDSDVIRRFNSVLVGLRNYYSGSEYPSALYSLFYTMRRSAALTIAHRHKLVSAAQAFKIWGKDLTIEYVVGDKLKTISFIIPKFKSSRWSSHSLDQTDFRPTGSIIPKTFNVVYKASDVFCSIPSCSSQAAEWHHIKHVKEKVNKNQKINKKLSGVLVARSQIPVCKKHHVEIHSGRYDGPSLSKLKDQYNTEF